MFLVNLLGSIYVHKGKQVLLFEFVDESRVSLGGGCGFPPLATRTERARDFLSKGVLLKFQN